MSERVFRKGEIYWFKLEEERKPRGEETQKDRPGVIISNDKQNEFSGVVIIALLTSKTDKIYPFEALVKVNNKENKVLTDQIYTIDKTRLGKRISQLTEQEIIEVEKGLH